MLPTEYKSNPLMRARASQPISDLGNPRDVRAYVEWANRLMNREMYRVVVRGDKRLAVELSAEARAA